MANARLGLVAGCVLALAGAVEAAACSNADSAGNAATSGGAGRGGVGRAAGATSLVTGAGQAGVLPRGGGAGDGDRGASGSSGAGGEGCEIPLAAFVDNGYRTCPPSDAAAVAGECWPQVRYEYGAREVCGNYRIYAFGHDGRIGCAYASTTGDLVGGFLDGIPSSAPHACPIVLAGPPDLAACPVPTTPWCSDGGAGGATDGGSGAGSESGGAGGVSAQGGAAGQP
jgi:hypothetical protein